MSAEQWAAASAVIGEPQHTWTCDHVDCFRHTEPGGPYHDRIEARRAAAEHRGARHGFVRPS